MNAGADALIAKATQAFASARVLLDSGDTDGACNRAYYAMFSAARAALLTSDAAVPADIARTHSGLISAFGLHLVRRGTIAAEFGRWLNHANEIRVAADYRGDSISAEDARALVAKAEAFLAAMRTLVQR